MANDRFGKKYDRLYTAVVTPFREDGKVDEPALRKLLQYFMQPKFVDAGSAIIINPEAGELYYLNRREKQRNVEIAVEECGGKVPVFAGAADLTTEDAVNVSRDAKDAGADGLFIFPPIGMVDVSSSWDPDKFPEVWLDMAKAQVDATDLPAIGHPVAGARNLAFGGGVPPRATLQICNEIPNIIGWKMLYSEAGAYLITKALRSLDRHVGIFWAGGHQFHEKLAADCFDGTLTGFWNYGMEVMVDHINAWRRKDIDEARRIWNSGLEDLHRFVLAQGHPHVTFKTGAWLRGLIPLPFGRPPLPKPRKEEVLALAKHLSAVGLSVIPDADIKRVTDRLPK